jgi:tyrosyl-DNA phosphodiesterase-1
LTIKIPFSFFLLKRKMSFDDENEQIARAMALSLQGLEAQINQNEQEDLDLKVAIAASLGKSVDQLTARDMLLSETPKITAKRPREEDEVEVTSGQHRVLKRFDNSNTQFWNGVVKLTFVKGFIGSDYIRFEEIVQKVCYC